jgi:hypothetical protein
VRSKDFGRLSLGLQLRSFWTGGQAGHATFTTLEVATCVCVCVHICVCVYIL